MHIIDFFTHLYNELEYLKDNYDKAYLEYAKNKIDTDYYNPKNNNNCETDNLDSSNNKNNINNFIHKNTKEKVSSNNNNHPKKEGKKKEGNEKENEKEKEEENEEEKEEEKEGNANNNSNENYNKKKLNAENNENENNDKKEKNEMNENSKWIKKIFLKLLFIFHPDKNILPNPPLFSLIKNSFENKNYCPLLFHFIQQKNNPFIQQLFLDIHESHKFLKSLESLSNLLILHINFIKSDPIFLKYHLSSGLK